jgi:hypothetical protein
VFTPAVATQTVLEAGGINDTLARVAMTAEGVVSWGDGALAHDTFVARTAAGTLKVHDGTVGGDGVLDMVFLQNTDSGGAAYNGAGMVNVLDDLNLALGQVYRINGVQFEADMLADGADVAHLSRTQTFTGAKTFDQMVVLNASSRVTALSSNGYVRIGSSGGQNALNFQVTGDTNPRFYMAVDGTMQWGDGTNPVDISLSRTAADILSIASGDRFEQAYNAAESEPTILVNRGTLDATLSAETASKAFALFIS